MTNESDARLEGDRLHVTIGYSAGGSLKRALADLNCLEQVAPLPDDFSMGPIDPGDAEQRAQWEPRSLTKRSQ